MQDREPNTLEHIGSEDVAASALPRQPAGLWDVLRRDVLRRDHDDILLVRTPYDGRALTGLLAAMAMAASFALGWTGALNWPEVETMLGLGHVAQKEAPSPHVAEAKPAGKAEGARKTIPTPDLRTAAPATVGSIPKPSTTAPTGARASAEPPNPVLASQANAVPAAVAVAVKPALAPPPETRPTTIPGWSVVEVRDGTAVLEGPDGIRMAARGDTIPGVGRIDSIVRWGNRWIVATANGLIATQ
jgi:hypothetical protein